MTGRVAVDERALVADVRRELEAHLELAVAEGVAAGVAADTARRAALARFGNVDAVVAACRREKLREVLLMRRLNLLLAVFLVLCLLALALQGLLMRRERLIAVERARAALHEAQERALALMQERPSPEPIDPTEIVVGVGDTLELVELSYLEGLHGTRTRVERDGNALMPELGWIRAAGMSRPDLERLLNTAYLQHHEGVRVCVRILE